jgi:hypothetical protein
MAFVSFEIGDSSGAVKVNVETGKFVDNRDKVAGVYPVKITASLSMVGELFTDLHLELVGDNELRAYGTAEVPDMEWVGEISVEITLSDLKEFDEENGEAVTGYYFKIREHQFNLPVVNEITVTGTGEFDGYDGKVYRNDTSASIALKVAQVEGTISLEVEPAEEE